MSEDRPKLLVVDDESKNIHAIKRLAEPLDLEVIEAQSGQEALRKVLHHDFFLILMDVQMPDMNGFEAAFLIHNNRETAHIPIIFVTAVNKEERFALQGYQAGAVDYIYKPLDPQVLISKINIFRELWMQRIALEQKNLELEHLNRQLLQTSLSLETTNQKRQQEIQEHKNTALALREARLEADDANRAKSEFLANTSHEIRTPLNAILGISYLALQTELTSKQHHYLNQIQNSSDHLLGIINDILDYSKIEADQLEVEEEPFQLEDVLQSIADLFAMKAYKEGVELVLTYSADTPQLLTGDSLRLGQVLINLVGNAIKFTEQGEVVLSVARVSGNDTSMTLMFEVRDTGIGMTKAQVQQVFKPFKQADSSTTRKYGGTGLGLAISDRLVSLMGGEIGVNSTPGVGTSFHCTLPFKNGHRDLKRFCLPSASLKGLRVLVVDDNEVARSVQAEMLRSFTFDPKAVASGGEALEELARVSGEQAYRVVVLDWCMPEMDGLEVVRKIKASPQLSPPPKVIMLTSYNDETVRREAEDLGVMDFLQKPTTPSNLFSAILKAVGASTSEAEPTSSSPLDFSQEQVASLQGSNILLVEDNEINQEVATELLKLINLEVTIANDGQQAVQILHRGDTQFDAVLMDCQMPVMNGYEASRAIRANPAFGKLPIIAMTANAMVGDREKCLNAGMNDHLAKPIVPDRLFKTLSYWIGSPGVAADRPLPKGAEEQAAAQEIPGVDTATAIDRLGGNKTLYWELLLSFAQKEADVVPMIRNDLSKDNWESAYLHAHSFQGAAGNLGVENLQEAMAKLEQQIKNRAISDIEKTLEKLQCDVDSTFECIIRLADH